MEKINELIEVYRELYDDTCGEIEEIGGDYLLGMKDTLDRVLTDLEGIKSGK